MARSRSLRGAPPWRRVLAEVEKRERNSDRGYHRTLRYDIDVAATARYGVLVIHVRYGLGSGFRDVPLWRPFLIHYAAEDVPVLTFLDGAGGRPAPKGHSGQVDSQFHVPYALAPDVIVRVVQTGRAYLAADDGQSDPSAPAIAWDDGDEYELALDAEMVVPGELSIVPFLERGTERADLASARIVLDGGVVVWRDRAASFDDRGQFPWISTSKTVGAIPLPEADLTTFLEEIHKRERAPRVALPPERAFERLRIAPRPYVVIKTHTAKGITLDPWLDYGGTFVNPRDEGHAVIDRANRRILDRDAAAEARATTALEEHGARSVGGGWRVGKRSLVDITRALLGVGWRVEIDGRLQRRATSLSFGISTGIDWLDVRVDAKFDGVPLLLPELLTAIRQGRRNVVLADGSVGEVPEEWVERLERWRALAETTSGSLRFRKVQAALVAALADKDGSVAADDAFVSAREELRLFDGVTPNDPPETFRGTLREYQREALGWFSYLRRFGFGGCLADDMGLGKTVQVLAMLDARRADRAGPSLVVAPRSVIYNWSSEAAKFAPELRVHLHDGARRLPAGDHFGDHDVVLTTYGLLRRDADALAKIEFDYVILDEAQTIKTARSAASKSARALRSRHKLALTGTPVENHLGELASLLDFLDPGLLGATGALTHLSPGARHLDDDTRELLGKAIRPFFLRRTKKQVAKELPDRVEQTLSCTLDPTHQRLYDELRDHYRTSLGRRIAKDGWGKSSAHVLEALLRLRQVACHPGLVDKARRGDSSAKLDTLLEHLASAREEGQKSLVFSQFTSLLSIVRARLDAASVTYEYLDGATRDRQKRVDRFQSDPDCSVFLLSIKAGGVGINLTAAEYVFLLDPWWNPATEAQAIDRAHRIGQGKTVFAYRLLARGTIEEKVQALQKEKRDLADSLFGDRGAALLGLTREDLENLLA
jgi:superfamily II DNA or RNA helicase